MTTALPILYRHHRWSNLALIDALAALPAETLRLTSPGTYGTIHRTLSHMVEGEQRYLATLKGVETIVAQALPDELPPLATLRAAAERQANDLLDIAGQLIETSTVTGTYNGRPFDMPAFIPLLQAHNHGAEHRTNITTTLAAHGHEAPALDVWAYFAAGMP
jgi:uncharacterized damage-inducible protein DinB